VTASVVWLAPSAKSFSCLCETCLDAARDGGLAFADAERGASVRGTVDADSSVSFARCAAGHELVLRRVERPAPLTHADERQLQLQ